MKRICTICARGGSKGVPGKNLRPLLGVPLIVHSIRQAQAAQLFQTIAVSSDDDAILKIAAGCGDVLLVKRPSELAGDASPKIPVIRHCALEVEARLGAQAEMIIDLDATSPLRNVADIRAVAKLLEERGVANVITGMVSRRSPYFNLVELNQAGFAVLSKPCTAPIGRRQDAPVCYDMNASIYAWQRTALFAGDTVFHPDTLLHVMPEERSIDIDSELDFKTVALLAAERGELL